MKYSNWAIPIIMTLMLGCHQWFPFNDKLSAEDEAAFTEILLAIEMTDAYNDTLKMYDEGNLPYDQNDWDFCEEQFHYFDSLFTHFNNQYSHSNNGDDHGHDAMGGMNEIMHGDRNTDHGTVHSINEHDRMGIIRSTHTLFH